MSKQRLSHWAVDIISKVYREQNLPVPVNLVAHSTRSMATSWAALRGVPLAEICGGPCTFCRFYRVSVAAPAPLGSAVLSAAGSGKDGVEFFVPHYSDGTSHPR